MARHVTSASLQPVYTASAFFSTIAAVYALAGLEPSPLIALGIAGGPFAAGAFWFRRHARANRVWLPYDWGFVLLPFWPPLLVWYAVRTRHHHALGLIARLLAAFLAPGLTWAVVTAFRAAPGG